MTIPKVMVLLVLAVKCQPGLSVNKPSVVVNLQQGSISGTTEDAGNGRSYYAFKSIPYAQPPVGDLRFRDPVRAKSWSGKRDGALIPHECPQVSFLTSEIVGSEDCLYLNVYTPRVSFQPTNLSLLQQLSSFIPGFSLTPFVSDLPVMVHIHGGAFQIGDVKDISPLPLLTEDIVLVTLHYRLGTLGFLSTEDSIMPGNLGLKDQTLALQWVQENIHNFGGNSNKVTVFGQSAGSVSTHLQVLTPYSAGLFQQAITQSGTALSPWAVRKGHRQVAAKVAEKLNCSETVSSSFENLDSQALLKCLQNVAVKDLVTLPYLFLEWGNYPIVMAPRVDGDYIPDHPAVLLKEGRYNKVNLITGIAAQDGDVATKILYYKEKLPAHHSTGNARRAFHPYLGKLEVTDTKTDTVAENWENYPQIMVPRKDGGDFLPNARATDIPGNETTKHVYIGEKLRNSLVENFADFGPLAMNLENENENPEYVARRAFHHYLGKLELTEDNADTVTQLFTDRMFSVANDHTALLHAKHIEWGTQVYMYELHHRGQYTALAKLVSNESISWVGHSSDLLYMFDSVSGYHQLERPDDLMLRHIMVKLWTNFATTGNPTPNQSLGFRWLPVTSDGLRHLRLKPDAAMHNDQRSQVREFWDALPTYQNSILFPERFSDNYFRTYTPGSQRHAGGPVTTSFTLPSVRHHLKFSLTSP